MRLYSLPNVLQPKISTAVLARISQYKHDGEDPDNISKLWSLFKLDARSDPPTLSVTPETKIAKFTAMQWVARLWEW
jgi:hypothetical protein